MLLIVHSFLVIFQVTCCNKISSSYHYYGHGEGHQRPNIFLPTRAGCRGSSSSTVCEEVDNYPEEHMKNILENLSDEQRVVFLSNTKKIKGGEVQKMDFHHFGFASNSQETPVCGTQKQTHHPAIAVTWNNEERFIVKDLSSRENQQMVVTEKCLDGVDNNRCSIDTHNFNTVCRQNYVNHRLLAINAEGKPYVDDFKFAMGCVCHKISNQPYLRTQQ